ncbi:hypothetical protein EVAR_89506_1 [Eumeta japonica]|uniref:Uncharacterized protein n=1 Tax=Eumeta variegata TaxID=151549 RepID=A0A4C1Y6M9_EUMVA|nr:hypothetical protein EVAR_89506_1 [Eumeta japonica]
MYARDILSRDLFGRCTVTERVTRTDHRQRQDAKSMSFPERHHRGQSDVTSSPSVDNQHKSRPGKYSDQYLLRVKKI